MRLVFFTGYPARLRFACNVELGTHHLLKAGLRYGQSTASICNHSIIIRLTINYLSHFTIRHDIQSSREARQQLSHSEQHRFVFQSLTETNSVS